MKVAASLFALLAIIAFRSTLQDRFQQVVTEAVTDKSATCLAMPGSTTREENGLTYIVGSLRNNCDRKFDHVTIAFTLDPPRNPRATRPNGPVLAYCNDLQPGETRQFRTMFQIGKNATYRFDKITAF